MLLLIERNVLIDCVLKNLHFNFHVSQMQMAQVTLHNSLIKTFSIVTLPRRNFEL